MPDSANSSRAIALTAIGMAAFSVGFSLSVVACRKSPDVEIASDRATLSAATGNQRASVAATGLFFVAGLVGLFAVDERAGRAAAEAWSAGAPES